MTATLSLPDPDLRALVTGEVIVAFVPSDTVASGAAVTLAGSGPRPAGELKPAYRRWASLAAPRGTWTATVELVVPALSLDPDAGQSRYVLADAGDGDVIALRVQGNQGPVLSEESWGARRASLEAALRS